MKFNFTSPKWRILCLQRARGFATSWRNKGFTNIFCTTISDLFEIQGLRVHYGVIIDYFSNFIDFVFTFCEIENCNQFSR